MKESKQTSDSPQVIAPPPLIYLGGLILGLVLHFIKPLGFLQSNLSLPLGIALSIISLALFAIARSAFVQARTNLDVRKPTTAIVTSGPYRFSRNPIYLSMTLLYLGITAWLNELWLLVFLIPIISIIQYGVIKREEFYLTRKFGEEYSKYKKSVRRWL